MTLLPAALTVWKDGSKVSVEAVAVPPATYILVFSSVTCVRLRRLNASPRIVRFALFVIRNRREIRRSILTIFRSRKALRENNGKRLRLGNPPPVMPARRPPAAVPPTPAEYGAPDVAKKTVETVKPLKTECA